MKQVEAEAKKLREQIRGMTVGSKEYFEATKRYRELDAVLREHRAGLRAVEVQQESLLSKGVRWFKEYSLQITGAIAALTGVAMKLNQLRKQAYEKEDAAANLKALTGLDDENIQWLTQQAEKISTTMEASGLRVRKSATEILEAYMLVGSKKPELLKDKEALNAVTIEAMRLAEASKMELKDAVAGVTIAMNQYGASADEAARYTNVLAAGSKYGAVNVATQTESIVKAGVAASTAKVPIEQLVGVLETLGERGIEGNRAGTQLKTFFLKLEAGAEETRPSVVGLQTALERLKAQNLDTTEITKRFGIETYTVAQALIDSTDKLRSYTEAVTDTNVAVEQAAINSDTAAAKMAQIRNQLNLTGQELAKTLAPVFSLAVGWTRKFIMAMPPVIDFLKKYGLTTAALLTTLVLYNTYTSIAIKTTSAWNAVIAFSKTQIASFKTILVAYRTALTGSTTAQVEMTAAVKGCNIVTKLAAVAVGLLKAAYYALSLQMTLCVRTLKQVKVALAETGWGIAILAIGAAVSAVIRYNEKKKESIRLAEEERAAQKALFKEYDEAAARIRRLHEVAEDHTASLEERRKAIEELQRLAPDYHASISKEGELIEDNKKKLDEYLERLKASIVLESYKTKMAELLQKQMEAEEAQKEAFDSYWDIAQRNTLQGYNRNSLTAKLSRFFGMEEEHNAKHAKDKADSELKEINKEIEATEKRMKEVAEEWNLSLVDDNNKGNGTITPDPTPDPTPESESEKAKRIREALEAIDAEYNKKAVELKQRYIDGDIETEEEYSSRLQQIELARLKAKMEIAGLDEKQQSDFLQRIMDQELEVRKRIEEMTKVSAKDKTEASLKSLDKEYKASKEILKTAYELGIIPTEERYNNYLLALENNFNLKKKELQEKQAEEKLNELKEQEDKERVQLLQSYAQHLIDEEEFQEKLLELRKKYAQLRADVENQSAKDFTRTAEENARVDIEINNKKEKKIISDAREAHNKALLLLRQRRVNELMTEEKYDNLVVEQTHKFYQELINDQKLNTETRKKIQEEYTDWSISQEEKKNEKLKQKNEDLFESLKSLGQDIGEAMAEFFTDSEKSFGDFMASILKSILDTIEKMLVAYIAQITMRDIANLGFAGIAKAAGEIALVTAAFETAKAAIGGFEAGGFTPDGRWDEPQGVVHSNEFVANRFAVNNPQVLPVLQLIDSAQRSGSISHLTGKDIAAVASGFVPSYRPVINLPASVQQAQSIDLSPLFATLGRLEKVMDRATEAYKEPSPAYCYVNGRGGINEAQELNDTINRNASRK